MTGLVVLSLACASSPGYRAPEPLEAYTFLVLERDSLADGLEAGLKAEGLRVRRVYRGGERAAAVVMVFPWEARLDVRVVDSRSGLVLVALELERAELPEGALDAGRALGLVVGQAIRRPPGDD